VSVVQSMSTQKLTEDEAALEAFEREIALPMLVLSLLVIPLLVVPLFVRLSRGVDAAFITLDWVIWAAFALEYGVPFHLSRHKGPFFRRNLLDLAIVILPFLRPLRVIRSARALRLLRSGRAVVFLSRGGKSAKEMMTRHGLHYALLVGAILVMGGALVVRELERTAAGSTIHSFGDAVWWALATMSTVGFGDKYPVTEGGRAVAVVLMFFGVGLFALIAASMASLFLGKKRERDVEPEVQDIVDRLDRIERALLAGMRTEEAEPVERLRALERELEPSR